MSLEAYAVGVCGVLLAAWYPDGVRAVTVYLLWQLLALAWALLSIIRIVQTEMPPSSIEATCMFGWLTFMCWLSTPSK